MRKAELALAVALTVTAVWLHVVRASHAGALWRDEVGALHVALMPSFAEMRQVFQHEAFPLLFPLTVRSYAAVAGTSDTALRVFGLLVGLSLLAALWYAVRTLTGDVPLVALSLVGTNALFLQWGDNLRGYGLGTALILLTFATMWRLTKAPSLAATTAAFVVAVCSVHVLYYNAVSLCAITLAAAAVALRNGFARRAVLIVATATAAAISLLPYREAIASVKAWSVVFTLPEFTFTLFRQKMWETLGSAGLGTNHLWLVVIGGALIAAIIAQAPLARGREPGRRDAGFYCLLVLLFTPPAYFVFLRALRYPTQPWYYFALLGLLAVAAEGALLALPWSRWRNGARIALASLIALASFGSARAVAHVRQTNMDLVAHHLKANAAHEDIVILAPWYLGVSFARYYSGDAKWITLPPVHDSRIHRYDLFKEQMASADAIASIFGAVESALANGHRVWVVGTLVSPKPGESSLQLPPAPRGKHGWAAGPYAAAWNQQLGDFVQRRARTVQTISVGEGASISQYENVALNMVAGWRTGVE